MKGCNQIKFKSWLGLYSGPYIVHSLHLRTVKEAEWLGQLWVATARNNRKRSTVHLGRIEIGVPRGLRYIDRTWLVKVLLFSDGNYQRRFFVDHWDAAVLLRGMWSQQSDSNSAVILMHIPSRGWVVDTLYFAELERKLARMASLAAASSKTKRKCN